MMLISSATKSGTGIAIFGDYSELNHLYDTIHQFSGSLDEYHSLYEKAQSELLMNFAYEVRMAFQGARLIDKCDDGTGKKRKIIFGCQFVWTDILIFMNTLRYKAGFSPSNKLHQSMMYNLEYAVESALAEYDVEGAGEIIRCIESMNFVDEYAFLLYQSLHKTFVSAKPGKKRFRSIPKLIQEHFSSWNPEYRELVAFFESSSKKQNCTVSDLKFAEFPEIVW